MSKKEIIRFEEEPAQFLEEFIKTIAAESHENRLSLIDDSPIFEEPLVGFADGEDSLFYEYKKIIGSFHLTPREVLEQSLSLTPHRPKPKVEDISVICWVLPIAKRTRDSNASMNIWPSLRWAHTRTYGEMFNMSLRHQLVSFLGQKGYFAVAPYRSAVFKLLERHPEGRLSNWSERHALYAAGMGTFGLSDGFITAW